MMRGSLRSTSRDQVSMIRAALVLKSLYIHKIIGFSPALAKHLPTGKSSIVRFASLRLVMKLLLSREGRPARFFEGLRLND